MILAHDRFGLRVTVPLEFEAWIMYHVQDRRRTGKPVLVVRILECSPSCLDRFRLNVELFRDLTVTLLWPPLEWTQLQKPSLEGHSYTHWATDLG